MKNNPRVNLVGVDIDRRCTMMACINCLFYGGCGTFLVGNTLCNEYEDGRRVSYGMLYEIPKENLKEIRFEKPEEEKIEEKSQVVIEPKITESIEKLQSYKV